MERIRDLNRYQKGLLAALLAMVVLFAGIYAVVSNRVGFLYQDVILIPSQEGAGTLYSGRIDGKDAVFTVTGGTVTFRHGEKEYGPYTVTEDPSAIPENDPQADHMTGLIIREGNTELFRGGCVYTDEEKTDFHLYTVEGWYSGLTVWATMSDGTMIDGNGNIVDPMKPAIGTILRLVNGPQLTSKGNWIGWICGVLISVVAAVSMLFADELFRWSLMFRVRDVDSAEPSDWQIAERYVGWTVGAVGALVLYFMGLR